jgi:hypothetical protein
MQRIRSARDVKPQEIGRRGITPYKPRSSGYELRCGVCGRIAYADAETASRVAEGSDKPFLCEICEVYDDDLRTPSVSQPDCAF